eukprot:462971_1
MSILILLLSSLQTLTLTFKHYAIDISTTINIFPPNLHINCVRNISFFRIYHYLFSTKIIIEYILKPYELLFHFWNDFLYPFFIPYTKYFFSDYITLFFNLNLFNHSHIIKLIRIYITQNHTHQISNILSHHILINNTPQQ